MANNMLQSLRVKKIFDSLFAPTNRVGVPQPITAPIDSPLNPASDLRQLRGRATPSIDQYKEYLQSEPDRKDYQSGKVQKILSAIAGFSEGMEKGPVAGYSATKGLIDRNYNEAVDKYQSKGSRLKELADLEYRGLTDDQKLAVQIADDEFKRLKEVRDWLKTNKDMDYTDKQMENLDNQINARGLRIEKNEINGNMEVVDITKGTRTSLGQFMESQDQKDTRNRNMFTFESDRKLKDDKEKTGIDQKNRKEIIDIEQNNRVELADVNYLHQKNIEGIRTANDRQLATWRAELGRQDKQLERDLEIMSPGAQKSAFELAYQQTANDMPDAEVDSEEFRAGVRERLKTIRARASGMQVNIPSAPNVTLPNTAPQQDTSTATAIAELAKIGITNPNPTQIEEALKDLGLK